MELPWAHPSHVQPLACIGREAPLALYLSDIDSPRRPALEAFIQARFAEQHGASVRHFMPCLLGLEDSAGTLLAAVGLRSGASGPLFLERYLTQPVETALSGQPARAQLVEVGNLAANSPGAARLLIVALTDLLVALGFRWVTFTGTTTLLNSFQRLGLSPLPLGLADPQCMGEELADWGSYYDCAPQVMAGDIYSGHQRLLHLGAYARLGHHALYAPEEMLNVACR